MSQERSTCPVCSGESALYGMFDRHGDRWRIDRCRACGHAFVVNRPTPERLAQVYADAETQGHEPWDEAWVMARADCVSFIGAVCALARGRSRSLDVGCGTGAFSLHLQRRGYTTVMTDLDPRGREVTSRIPGSTFHFCAFEELPDPGPFDVIIMSQVLEHALDPMDWLRRAQRLLAPGGVLGVAVPNFGGVYRLLGHRDPFIHPPMHLNYFTADSLERAFASAGLRTAKMDSYSRVATHNPVRDFSGARIAAGHLWNALSLPLNLTTKGVVLRGFATRNGALR